MRKQTCLMSVLLSLITLLLIVIVTNITADQVMAQQLQNSIVGTPIGQRSTLSVGGTASSNAVPDEVIVSLGVENSAVNAEAARNANAAAMTRIMGALVNTTGLSKDQITTRDFRIIPNYNDRQVGNAIRSYIASSTINIKSPALESVSKWIDTAFMNGANKVNSIAFDSSPTKQAVEKQDLVKRAFANTKNLADTLASEVGI
jgi:uncharacterized protein